MKADISHGQVVNETITTCLHPPTCPIAMSKVAWVCPKPDGTWTQLILLKKRFHVDTIFFFYVVQVKFRVYHSISRLTNL